MFPGEPGLSARRRFPLTSSERADTDHVPGEPGPVGQPRLPFPEIATDKGPDGNFSPHRDLAPN